MNASDSRVAIVDCIYADGPTKQELQKLTVRYRVNVKHNLSLPLKSCYSAAGKGFLISGSEDAVIHIHSLAKGVSSQMQLLKHHEVPVVAVACNAMDTLLVSADTLGRIVFWRRKDFSEVA